MLETRGEYVTVQPASMSHFRIKNTVLVLVGMRMTRPCARRPMLLDRICDQTSASGQRLRWQYSRDWNMTSSITAWVSNWRRALATSKYRVVYKKAIW